MAYQERFTVAPPWIRGHQLPFEDFPLESNRMFTDMVEPQVRLENLTGTWIECAAHELASLNRRVLAQEAEVIIRKHFNLR